MNNKFFAWAASLHAAAFVPLVWFVSFFASFILRLALRLAGAPGNPIDTELNYPYMLYAVAIAPIVETFLFQKLPIELLEKRIKSTAAVIAISAVLFGIIHLKSFYVVLQASVSGVFLSAAYILYRESHGAKKAFWVTAAIHALDNLTVFILRILSGIYF